MSSYRRITAATLALLVLLSSAACLSRGTKKRYARAINLFEQEMYSEALPDLEAVYEARPSLSDTLVDELVEAHLAVGHQALAAGDLDEAASHFQRVLQITPSAAAARLGLAQVAAAKKSWSRAVEFLREALPGLEGAQRLEGEVLLARALFGKGDYLGALEQARRLLGARPDNPEARIVIGRILLEKGDVSGAADELGRALALDEDNADAQYYYGLAQLKLGEGQKAAQAIERALFLDPAYLNSGRARLALAQAYLEQGIYERAQQEFARAIEMAPSLEAEAARGYGIAAFETGSLGLAEHYLTMARDQAAGKPDALTDAYLGEIAYRNHDLDAARRYLAAAESDPNHGSVLRLHRLAGLLALDEGRETDAIRHFKAFLEAGGEDVTARYWAGRDAFRSRDYDEAVRHLGTAVSLDASHRDAQFFLALAYEHLRDYASAIEHYQEILTLHPDDAPAHLQLGLIYAKYVPNRAKAIEHWERFLALRPDDPQAAALRGNVAILKRKQEEEEKRQNRHRRRRPKRR